MTKDEIRKDLVALIPIGSVEQHGPHLPMGTDSIIAEKIAKRVEEELKDKVVLFPTIYFTCSLEHSGFPYFGVSYMTLFSYLVDLLNKVKEYFSSAVIINAHGGNSSLLDLVRRQINFTSEKFKVYVFNVNELYGKDLHAGSVETSILKFISPDLVKEERLKGVSYDVKERVFETVTTSQANPYGIINLNGEIKIDPRKGKEVIDYAVKEIVKLILKAS